MHKEKKGFLLYKDNYQTIQKLTIEEQAELLTAMFDYSITGETKDLSHSVDLVFSFMKRQFDRDNDKYNAICERNRINGLKGGRPKNNPENPVGYLETQGNPKKPIIDNRQKIIDNRKEIKTTTNSGGGFDFYQNNINLSISSHEAERIKDMLKTYSEEWFINACKIAIDSNARSLRYIEGILKKWKESGYQDKNDGSYDMDRLNKKLEERRKERANAKLS